MTDSQCYLFVLKTYNDDHAAVCGDESMVRRDLRGHRGMIRYILQYSHEEDQREGKTSWNMLLEYGDSDLQEYFLSHVPPVFEDEQLCFWSNMCLVVDAVQKLHELQHQDVGRAEGYYG